MTPAPTTDASALAQTFARQGYVMVRGLVGAERVAAMRAHLEDRAARGTLRMMGDDTVPKTPCAYGDHILDGLMQELCPAIEAHTGLSLFPTYSYARIYKHGDILGPHRDRPACEISISLNLGQVPDEPWALHMKNDAGEETAALLHPGDVLIYRGLDLTHWREPFPGQSMAQVFLHYVDQTGPHAGEKFDSRPTLGSAFQPDMTGRLRPFLIPDLI
ncbi:MAG TPA: hypothetical protein VK515_00820 [Rhizomicrobium sp.]|nr:hypothetical protein [Rhizomicrobium sp.]